ncbi:MAG TPA: ABC transporter ATP-binding protein [Conexibacter sp.]
MSTEPIAPGGAGGATLEHHPILRFDGLSKEFGRGGARVLAVDDVSLEVREGELVTIVGPSGCGKSTLLKIAAGLQRASGGSVSSRGEEVTSPSPHIGMMFQTPVLFPWRTTLENVLLPVDVAKADRGAAQTRAQTLLDRAGIGAFAQRYPTELSGGMQQRAALTRLLMQDPDLMLMDEPFGALDEFSRDDMNLHLLDVWAQSGKTVVLVTHSIQEAVFLADRVMVMTPRPGRLAETIEVDLPRPRELAMTTTPEFQEIVLEVRRVLGAL